MAAKISVKSVPLEDLRDYFEKQILAIPNLQRNFVWNILKVRDLADSLYKGYPIGVFTIWDAPKGKEKDLRHATGLLPAYESRSNKRIHYVIDGQQRLVVLNSFLTRGGKELRNDRGQNFNSNQICFSFKKDQEGLNFVYSKRGPDYKRYVSICDILSDKSEGKLKFLKKKNRAFWRAINECRTRLRTYQCGLIYLKADHFFKSDDLKETFIRLNTRGMPLSAVDRAYAYASDIRLREYVARIKEKLGILKTIDETPIQEVIYLISSKKLHRFNSRSIDVVVKKINDNPEERTAFQRNWKKIARAVENAERFLKNQGVKSPDLLPSKTMVAVLSMFYYYHGGPKLSPRIKAQLQKWFWCTAVGSRYSGSGYTRNILKDCEPMKALAKGNQRAKFDLDNSISKNALVSCMYYSKRSSLTRAFYCLLAKQNPKEFDDYKITMELTIPTQGQSKQKHHIFPRNLMIDKVPKYRYNSIINVCFLPRRTNASFQDNPPWEYLNTTDVDKENIKHILKSHFIPQTVIRRNRSIKNAFNEFFEGRTNILVRAFEKEAGAQLFESS